MLKSILIAAVVTVLSLDGLKSDDAIGRYELDESNVDTKPISFEDYLPKLIASRPPKRSVFKHERDEDSIIKKKNSDLEVEGELVHYDSSDSRLNEIFSSLTTTQTPNKDDTKVLESRSYDQTVKPDMDVKTSDNGKASLEQQISQISLTNPEYRMIGPNKSQEILMGDDVASTLLVALDNMQQEAKELWSQVSETVDDQWTQLKRLIERNLETAPKEDKPASTFSTRKLQSTSDIGLDLPASVDPGAVSDNKANTFLNNIGISTDAQKKASELISNAGTSIKEVAQKDIPVAYEKAKTALSETVTKDIPNYWNKLFGPNKSTN